MESKKVNIFAFVMIIFMCAFSIFIGVSNSGKDGTNGQNGMSAYELAIKNGVISSEMSEYEYLKSLQGKDGSSVTLEDVYKAYLKETGKTSEELTYTEFILTYYPDKIVSDTESVSRVENTTQNALRSTVDICYSFCMDSTIVYGYYSDNNFILDKSNTNKYVSIGVSAGSGVIYSYEDTDGDGTNDVAYIVTNYHVVYCSNYSNDDKYRVFYDSESETYFTGTYDESKVKTTRQSSFFGTQTYYYLSSSDIETAPIYTHFLDTYGVYLYGYQTGAYEISAKFVGGSAENDIAVLKIERNDINSSNELIFSENYKAVDLGDSSSLSEGKAIVAVGNPLLADTSKVNSSASASEYVASAKKAYVDALCLTSTSGEISNLSEECVFSSLIGTGTTTMRLIRVSSAINAGNSGGGLYSTDGRLVGIVNGKVESESYDNIGYAIPINVASRIADQIISQCGGGTNTRIKVVSSSSLGLDTSNKDSSSHYDSDSLKWVIDNNVTVDGISANLETAGLKINDCIESITINGVTYKVSNNYDINDILLLVKQSDSSVTLNVSRLDESNNKVFEDVVISLQSANFAELV